MEDRVAELESEVQAFLRRPASMGHPLIRRLLGENNYVVPTQALVSPALPLYTGEPRDSETTTLEPNSSVTPESLPERYVSVTRSVPEYGLGQLGLNSEVPLELSEYL